MDNEIFEALDKIDVLGRQVEAILELIMMSDSSVTPSAVTTGAEMALDMHTELMSCVSVFEKKIRDDMKSKDS